MERLRLDYVGELAREAAADPAAGATVVAIGIQPFVMGTPLVPRRCGASWPACKSRGWSGSPTLNRRCSPPVRSSSPRSDKAPACA